MNAIPVRFGYGSNLTLTATKSETRHFVHMASKLPCMEEAFSPAIS